MTNGDQGCSRTFRHVPVTPGRNPVMEPEASQSPRERFLSGAVALLGTASLLVGAVTVGPSPVMAKPRMTPEEQLTIEIFRKNTPSVVNVTNLAVKRDAFTMNMLELPQGQGSGFIWVSRTALARGRRGVAGGKAYTGACRPFPHVLQSLL